MNTNDDQNLKKLTDRLVAMSPEPPPFPEEVPMSQPSPARSPFQPLAVFAGALVLVLLGFGIPFILMNGNGAVIGDDTTTTTSVPQESTTTDPGEVTTTTTLPGNPTFVDTLVFLTQSPENSFKGDPALVPFQTVVQVDPGSDELERLRATLNMLGNPDLQVPDGFTNSVPAGVEVLDIRRADGEPNALIVEMNEAFLEGGGGLLGDFTMLNQLIYTATGAQPDVVEVQFIVNNSQVTQFGSEGLDLSSSVNRESFQENLALIYLTSPILPNQDGNVVVEGISNTFEASMALQILDGEGNLVHEEFGTATCGSGCWGDYLFVLDADLLGEDSVIELFEYSAEDGDPQNIISIPYNNAAGWDLLDLLP